ncbi:MAG: regulator [Betaproteobacteria bacterium]|nr:regulator [Betaproteobacteria bacterium]
MAIDYRIAALGLVALGGLVAGVATMNDKPQPVAGTVRASTAIPAQPRATAAQTAPPDNAVVAASPGAQAVAARAIAAPPTEGKAGASAAPNPKFTHFRVGNRNVKRILIDGERVWVGTSGGVIRYSAVSDEYRLYDMRSGLRADAVVYIGKLLGRIAVGTYGGGLSILDSAGDKWETFGTSDGLGDEFVSDALVASNGDVWIATGSGVNRVRGGALRERAQWDLYTAEATNNGLPSNRVYGLAEGTNGDIWLATERGVARFQRGEWNHWNHGGGPGPASDAEPNPSAVKADAAVFASPHGKQKAGLHPEQAGATGNPNFTVSVTVDGAGVVWAGTLGSGLARYDGSGWRYYTVADGLPGNHVFSLHEDARNRLWVGTDKGLARLKDGKFNVMTTQDGLFTNAVFAVASMSKGMWVGGRGGVARIHDLD